MGVSADGSWRWVVTVSVLECTLHLLVSLHKPATAERYLLSSDKKFDAQFSFGIAYSMYRYAPSRLRSASLGSASLKILFKKYPRWIRRQDTNRLIFNLSWLSLLSIFKIAKTQPVMRLNSWTWFGQNSFPFCYSQSALLTDLPPHPLEQKWFETGCNVNIVYGNLKSENSQNYAQKPRRNCTFMNSASALSLILFGVTHKSILRKKMSHSSAKECIEVIHKMIVIHIPRDDNTVQKNAGKKCTDRHHYIIQIKKADFKMAHNAYKI